MLILLRVLIHLFRFSFRDVLWINTDNGASLCVYSKHYLCGFFAFHGKKELQNFNDELHRRVVVVDKNDLMQARLFGFRPNLGTRLDTNVAHRPVLCSGT